MCPQRAFAGKVEVSGYITTGNDRRMDSEGLWFFCDGMPALVECSKPVLRLAPPPYNDSRDNDMILARPFNVTHWSLSEVAAYTSETAKASRAYFSFRRLTSATIGFPTAREGHSSGRVLRRRSYGTEIVVLVPTCIAFADYALVPWKDAC